MHAEMCAVELYMTISCIYDAIICIRWFNIANPFYFNLSEVFFNLNQKRKLHAINCVLFFAEAFTSSLIVSSTRVLQQDFSWIENHKLLYELHLIIFDNISGMHFFFW